MSKEHVCPASMIGFLDNWFRRLVQNPYRILSEHIKEGDKVADIGCGPGFFSIPMAKITGAEGRVDVYDLQPVMLEAVDKKARREGVEGIINAYLCKKESLGLQDGYNFVLGFYMVHELPDVQAVMKEVYASLLEGGEFLVVEPCFHVTAKQIKQTIAAGEKAGFSKITTKRTLFSRKLLFKKQNTASG